MIQKNFPPLSLFAKLELFTHLASMEKAGIPTQLAFGHLTLPGKIQSRVENARRLLSRGKDIANAGKSSGLFDALECRLVQAATQAGSPALSYRRLADLYTEKYRLQQALRARLRLPIFMLIISLFLRQLPALASGAISAAHYFLSVIGPLIFLYALYLAIAHYKQSLDAQTTVRQPNILDDILLRLPIFGPMNLRNNARYFYEALGMLLEAGMPMFEALPLASACVANAKVRMEFEKIRPRMQAGEVLSSALVDCIYRGQTHIVEWVRTGEVSGTLPDMLWRYCETERQAYSLFQEQLAAWLPRVAYSLVAIWVVYGIFTSNAFMPQVPTDL